MEYYATRPVAYDGVESYVASTAPGRLARAKRHLAAIRPFKNDTGAYFRWYMEQADEHPLGRVDARQFLVDLRGPAPRAVRARLNRAMVTRGFPEGSYDSTTTGGRPGEWFDLVVHRQRVRPVTPLTTDG